MSTSMKILSLFAFCLTLTLQTLETTSDPRICSTAAKGLKSLEGPNISPTYNPTILTKQYNTVYLDQNSGDSVQLLIFYQNDYLTFSSLKNDVTAVQNITIPLVGSTIYRAIGNFLVTIGPGYTINLLEYRLSGGSCTPPQIRKYKIPYDDLYAAGGITVFLFDVNPITNYLTVLQKITDYQSTGSPAYLIQLYDLNTVTVDGDFSKISTISLSYDATILFEFGKDPLMQGNVYLMYNTDQNKMYELSSNAMIASTFYTYQAGDDVTTYTLIANVIVLAVFKSTKLEGKIYHKLGITAPVQVALKTSVGEYKVYNDKVRNVLAFADSTDSTFIWYTALVDGTVIKSTLAADFEDFTSSNTLAITLSGNRAFILQDTKIIFFENFKGPSADSTQKISQIILSSDKQAYLQSEQNQVQFAIIILCDCVMVTKIVRFSCFSSTLNCLTTKLFKQKDPNCKTVPSPLIL